MRLSLALACTTIALLSSGCAARFARLAAYARPPVVVADTVRESAPNDYMRVSFLSPGTEVTTLARPGALRAFATATTLYMPPIKVANYPAYSGLVDNEKNVLVAMRCRPPQPEKVDALLATWPNVFLAIQRDVPVDPSACSAHPADAPTQMACYARAFSRSADNCSPNSARPDVQLWRESSSTRRTSHSRSGSKAITESTPPSAAPATQSRTRTRSAPSP